MVHKGSIHLVITETAESPSRIVEKYPLLMAGVKTPSFSFKLEMIKLIYRVT